MIEQPSFQTASMEKPKRFIVPEKEITTSYTHSSGAGGQYVNKRDTKAQISWHIAGSSMFTDEQKIILERELRNRMNSDLCVVLANQKTRSREQNRNNAIDRLNDLVTEALTPEKDRIPTKPTRSSQVRRLNEKTLESKKKEGRRPENWE
jgi:ribosome-associated protein